MLLSLLSYLLSYYLGSKIRDVLSTVNQAELAFNYKKSSHFKKFQFDTEKAAVKNIRMKCTYLFKENKTRTLGANEQKRMLEIPWTFKVTGERV